MRAKSFGMGYLSPVHALDKANSLTWHGGKMTKRALLTCRVRSGNGAVLGMRVRHDNALVKCGGDLNSQNTQFEVVNRCKRIR